MEADEIDDSKPFVDSKTGHINWFFGEARRVRARRRNKLGPPNRFGVRLNKPYALYPHQDRGAMWLVHRELNPHLGIVGGIFCLMMGLGKTLSMLHLAMLMRGPRSPRPPSRGPEKIARLVVLDIASIHTWKEEIAQFFGSSLKYVIFTKDNLKRKFTTARFADYATQNAIVITTYDTVKSVHSKPQDNNSASAFLFQNSWSAIVCDESQRMCNMKTDLFQAMMALKAPIKWCLSATPVRNNKEDLLSQFRFCGYAACKSTKSWSKAKFVEHRLGEECVMVMNYANAGITLPEKKVHNVITTLSPREKLLYSFMFSLGEMALIDIDNGQADFASILSLFTRLRQIPIAPILIMKNIVKKSENIVKVTDYRFGAQAEHGGVPEESKAPTTLVEALKDKFQHFRARHKTFDAVVDSIKPLEQSGYLTDITGAGGIGSTKMRAMVNVVTNMIPRGEKIIGFCDYTEALKVSKVALEAAGFPCLVITGEQKGDQRSTILNAFKTSPSKNVLLMSTVIGSKSLNLTCATNIFFLNETWCPSVRDQAEARAHRIGQTKVVHVWRFICQNTIEEPIEQIGSIKRGIHECFLSSEQKADKNFVPPRRKTISVDMIKTIMQGGKVDMTSDL